MIFCIDSLSSLREENMIQMACAVNFSLKRRMTTAPSLTLPLPLRENRTLRTRWLRYTVQ